MNEFLDYVESCIDEGKHAYCIPLNLTKYVTSKKDSKLCKVINSADLIISDGIPIEWLSRRLGYKDVFRLAGIDLAEAIISRSKINGWKLFFFGGLSKNLKLAIENINKKFDNPNVVGHRNGYFGKNDIDKIIDTINKSKADILFLGLGLPQKEYFIHDHYNKIKVKFCLPVGGTFDVWACTKRRSPQIIQKIGLEWLYRSFYDKSRALFIAKYGLIYLKDLLFYKK